MTDKSKDQANDCENAEKVKRLTVVQMPTEQLAYSNCCIVSPYVFASGTHLDVTTSTGLHIKCTTRTDISLASDQIAFALSQRKWAKLTLAEPVKVKPVEIEDCISNVIFCVEIDKKMCGNSESLYSDVIAREMSMQFQGRVFTQGETLMMKFLTGNGKTPILSLKVKSMAGIQGIGDTTPRKIKEGELLADSRISFEIDDSNHIDEKMNAGTLTIPWIKVGRIWYDESHELGKGCHDTVVFRGINIADRREVAVKRAEKHSFTKDEIERLSRSCAHQHVVTYYSPEIDNRFQYIVLELCDGSLHDYVEKKQMHYKISSTEILRQTTEGLRHLHSQQIVHNGFKPLNVLLSSKGRERTTVLISDFGLSKHINPGSQRNGVRSTSGWSSAEALKGEGTSYPTDVFSLGCIFYYVLTEGSHPFDFNNDNIRNGKFSWEALGTDTQLSHLASHLIDLAISRSPYRRPSASSVLLHPLFWEAERQLGFFSKVSNKLDGNNDPEVRSRIETNQARVVKKDWLKEICAPVKEDLLHNPKHNGSYKGHSLIHLLKAMRNKKEHPSEWTDQMSKALGAIPDEYVTYFTRRFPELLLHVYKAMEVRSDEPPFDRYYPDEVRTKMEKKRKEDEAKAKKKARAQAKKEINGNDIADATSDA